MKSIETSVAPEPTISGELVYHAGFPGMEQDWSKLVPSRRAWWERLASRLAARLPASTLLSGPEILAAIQVRIGNIERAPSTWGGPEALEMQAHLFIEMRQMIVRPKALAANPFETRDAYHRFVRKINGEPTNTFLWCILRREGRLDELPRLLGDYGRWVAETLPPEK